MIALARASRNAISTSVSPSGTQPHFLIRSMSSSTKGEISSTSLSKVRSSSMRALAGLREVLIVNLPGESATLSSIGRKFSPKHRPLAFRLFFRRFVLDDVPMLDKNSVPNDQDIRGDPIHRSTDAAKPPVHDHELPISHDHSRLILQRRRNTLDEIEQAFTARFNARAVLNVLRRPETLGRRVVTLIEQGVEGFQDQLFVLFFDRPVHFYSPFSNVCAADENY